MKTLGLLFVLLFLVASCQSGADMKALDDEYSLFAYEQQKYRREELEKLYEQERARSDELTEKILELRREIEEKERELRELEKRRDGN
jgi:Skp family chaperone for outer membrane proteins